MKILVADDDPTSRRIIEVCLTDAGYEVSIAVDGAQALEMIARPGSPRLLVLDRTMPHVDGLDVCRTIRKNAVQPDVYIILLSNRVNPTRANTKIGGVRTRLTDAVMSVLGTAGSPSH